MDTIGKRLMTNKSTRTFTSLSTFIPQLNRDIFKEHASSSIPKKLGSLYPGLHFATLYKILQRTYKFGAQPIIKGMIETYDTYLGLDTLSKKPKNILTGGLSGSIVGLGEIGLLPLDALKIRMQTNPTSVNNSFLNCIKQEGLSLYKGASWTAARNIPGSFSLFAGNEFSKAYIVPTSDTQSPTLFQNSVSSITGSSASPHYS